MKKDLTELIYGAALRTAGRTKEQHFRRWAEAFNRDLAEKMRGLQYPPQGSEA